MYSPIAFVIPAILFPCFMGRPEAFNSTDRLKQYMVSCSGKCTPPAMWSVECGGTHIYLGIEQCLTWDKRRVGQMAPSSFEEMKHWDASNFLGSARCFEVPSGRAVKLFERIHLC